MKTIAKTSALALENILITEDSSSKTAVSPIDLVTGPADSINEITNSSPRPKALRLETLSRKALKPIGLNNRESSIQWVSRTSAIGSPKSSKRA
nr:hypothetical protein [Halothiobacillus neapolitanus]